MSLEQLPLELLLRVSSHLTTPELGYLRRTCKNVEAAIFDSFAREFFTKRQFMIEYVSLQALIEIASHPTLSCHLSEVIIGLDMFKSDSAYLGAASQARYKAGHPTRDTLLETGQARDMLVEAFSKLPNLRTVGLRDYSARGRYRDGEDANWRSYGWSFGLDPGRQPTWSSHSNHHRVMDTASPVSTLPLILYALGCAHSKPESIEVFLRNRKKLKPSSLSVLDGFLAPKVLPVLTGLKKLMLTISLDGDALYGAPWLPCPQDNVTGSSLMRLLHHTPALEVLRLNFAQNQFFAQLFLDWLSTSTSGLPSATIPPSQSIPPISLPSLTSLDLGMLNIDPSTLLNVICKFNLASLSLWKVELRSDSLDNIIRNTKPDCWDFFLADLSRALPDSSRLRSVLLGYTYQCHRSSTMSESVQIYFTPPAIAGSRPSSTKDLLEQVAYRAGYGTSVKEWFQSMSTRTSFAIEESESSEFDSADSADSEGLELEDEDEDEESDD